MSVRSLSAVVIVVSGMGLLAYTNPDQPGFETYLNDKILTTVDQRARLEAPGDVEYVTRRRLEAAAMLMVAQTARSDYVLFSTYRSMLPPDLALLHIGALKNFFLLTSEGAVRAHEGATAAEAEKPSVISEQAEAHPTPEQLHRSDADFLAKLASPLGQYPREWLLEHPEIERRLHTLLDADVSVWEENFAVQSPLGVIGGYLVLSGCRQHACNEAGSIAFVATDMATIHCAVFTNRKIARYSENPSSFPHEALAEWRCGFSAFPCEENAVSPPGARTFVRVRERNDQKSASEPSKAMIGGIEGEPQAVGTSRPEPQLGPGLYRIVRETPLRSHPDHSASQVALLRAGTVVRVTHTQDEWLHVMPQKQGRSPGYIPGEVAVPME